MDLKVNFNVNPVAAAQELAVDLGDSSAHWKSWHRACAWLDELRAAAIADSQTEQRATEKASAIRRAEHLANTRDVLAALYTRDDTPAPSSPAAPSGAILISNAECLEQARETVLKRMNQHYRALLEAHPDDEVKCRYLTTMREITLVNALLDSARERIDASDKSIDALGALVMEVLGYLKVREGKRD